MQLKSLVNAVALALFAASAHAQAPAGIYSIINGGATEPLAITFDSQGQALTVTTEDVTSTKKLWVIKDDGLAGLGGKQTISPLAESSLQCAWGNNVVTTQPAGSFVWTITQRSGSTYNIQDGGETVYWGAEFEDVDGVHTVFDGAKVTIGKGSGGDAENVWIFNKVLDIPSCIV